MTDGRRLALLLAGADDSLVRQAATAERRRLGAVLGPGLAGATIHLPPATNPMEGTGSMMAASAVSAVLEADLAAEVSDDAVVDVIAGLADSHRRSIDPQASAVLVGRVHVLRDRPVPAGASPLRVLVALRGRPGLTADEVRARWLAAGRINAAGHPTCARYAQLHADPTVTARATVAAGFAGAPFTGLAIEVFPTAADLHAGHRWAGSPVSVAGAGTGAAHLMDLLGGCLDLPTARPFLALDPAGVTNLP